MIALYRIEHAIASYFRTIIPGCALMKKMMVRLDATRSLDCIKCDMTQHRALLNGHYRDYRSKPPIIDDVVVTTPPTTIGAISLPIC